jgi:cobalt/nickel transport system permease protein
VHYIVLDRLSRGSSFLHSRDARFKIVALLIFLTAIATNRPFRITAGLAYLAALGAGIALARLPVGWIATRALVVVPFSAVFAGISILTGNTEQGLTLVGKSYLSALAVLLVVASTPLPSLLTGFARLGVPAILVTIIQFLYRYLFVITDEARRMWLAAQLRGSALSKTSRKERMISAGGTLAVLFGRSLEKAEGIHMAMLARGFTGVMPGYETGRAGARDILFVLSAALIAGCIRFQWVRL